MDKEYCEGRIICLGCDYSTESMYYKAAEYQVYLDGGYFRFDENGMTKHKTICPRCEKNKLMYDPS
jgi:ribosomal protein S27AE